MRSIVIGVPKKTGRLFFDGLHVSDGCWLVDTRKVRVRVHGLCALAAWANERLIGSRPFVIEEGKHSKQPVPNLQKAFKREAERKTVPVVYEGAYRVHHSMGSYSILKPVNRSSWRVMLGMHYFEMFDDAEFHFESPPPTVCGGVRCVVDALRVVTDRGALCGFLQPCAPRVSMAVLRKQVVKDGDGV